MHPCTCKCALKRASSGAPLYHLCMVYNIAKSGPAKTGPAGPIPTPLYIHAYMSLYFTKASPMMLKHLSLVMVLLLHLFIGLQVLTLCTGYGAVCSSCFMLFL